jgi:hypothetical protein
MATSCQDVDKMLQSLAQDASNDIARAIEDVANKFITSGGYGSSHMHMAISEKVTEIFRFTADVMTMQARRCVGGSGGAVRDLVDTHLSYLIDQTIKRRTKHMESGKTASQDTEILCATLRQDLKLLKDAALRALKADL